MYINQPNMICNTPALDVHSPFLKMYTNNRTSLALLAVFFMLLAQVLAAPGSLTFLFRRESTERFQSRMWDQNVNLEPLERFLTERTRYAIETDVGTNGE